MIALCQSGDEVILPTPWYFNHEMVLKQLSISLVPLPCQPPSFLPSVDLARSLVTPRTKAIVLVTPNNPTGALYPKELLEDFANLAEEKGIALVLDETYRDFVDGRPHDLFAETEWRKYLVHLFSFSK
jgi:aspartate/methionine/tyrosine aminotransferase